MVITFLVQCGWFQNYFLKNVIEIRPQKQKKSLKSMHYSRNTLFTYVKDGFLDPTSVNKIFPQAFIA